MVGATVINRSYVLTIVVPLTILFTAIATHPVNTFFNH
jgi:hypothetical protein